MEDRVNTFEGNSPVMAEGQPVGKRRPGWVKGLIIFGAILLALIVLAVLLSTFSGKSSGTSVSDDGKINIKDDYIGELTISGTISEYEYSGMLSDSSYHHQWLLDRVDDMIDDSHNKGLLLYMDSPGGSVYASDEMYLKVKEYKEKTGRPVYSYFSSEAASGAYYIASASDDICANRNAWTGSIGVTLSTIYDLTGLMEKYGVKAVTIHAGKNKAMGSSAEEMTQEQKEILQSLVDEAYEQFVGIVAEGRKMPVDQVKKLADGRIYTAKQAMDKGLVDQVCSYEEAVARMKLTEGLGKTKVELIEYEDSDGWLKRAVGDALGRVGRSEARDELEILKSMMDANGTFQVTYTAAIKRDRQ